MKRWYVTVEVIYEVEAETAEQAHELALAGSGSIFDSTLRGEEPAWGDPAWTQKDIDAWQLAANEKAGYSS